jgi:hypothetical protein
MDTERYDWNRKRSVVATPTDTTIPFQGCATDTKLPHQP